MVEEYDDKKIEELRRRQRLTMTSREYEESERRARAIVRKKRLLISAIIITVLGLAALAVYLLYRRDVSKLYSSYEATGTSTVSSDLYGLLGETVINYSRDGAYVHDEDGSLIWDQGFYMSNPVFVSSQEYGLIFDRGGTSAVVFTETGVSATYELTQTAAAAGLSEYGVAAFMIQSGTAGSVVFYDKSGHKLDIEIKNVLAESSGYPISMTLSPSGNGLVLSLVYLDQGSMRTRISFMNFDVGKDISDRVVGYFEYDGNLFPEVDYIGSSALVAFGDDRAVFYSLADESSPEVSREITYEEEISAVLAGADKAAVVLQSESGGYTLKVYDAAGNETLSYDFEFEFSHAEISGDYVLIYGGESTLITGGAYVKYCGSFDGTISSMVTLGRRRFLQYGTFGDESTGRIVELK